VCVPHAVEHQFATTRPIILSCPIRALIAGEWCVGVCCFVFLTPSQPIARPLHDVRVPSQRVA
jgi:hypothetical protein